MQYHRLLEVIQTIVIPSSDLHVSLAWARGRNPPVVPTIERPASLRFCMLSHGKLCLHLRKLGFPNLVALILHLHHLLHLQRTVIGPQLERSSNLERLPHPTMHVLLSIPNHSTQRTSGM